MTFRADCTTQDADHELLAALVARRDHFVMFLQARGFQTCAEDILQAAYLRLVERRVSLRDKQNVTSWFYAVLRNAAIDGTRASRRRHRLADAAAREPITPSDAHEEHARIASILALLDELEPSHRDVLDSMYVQGLSIRDIAQRLGITRNAATVRVHRARRALGALVA